jgi:hypothetical protein
VHGAEPITSTTDGYCTPTGAFDPGAQPFALAPGERAFALVVWRNTATTNASAETVLAPTLTVTPLDGTAPQHITPDGPLDLGNTGRLGLSAWMPPTTC